MLERRIPVAARLGFGLRGRVSDRHQRDVRLRVRVRGCVMIWVSFLSQVLCDALAHESRHPGGLPTLDSSDAVSAVLQQQGKEYCGCISSPWRAAGMLGV